VLLSGRGDSDTIVSVSEEKQDTSNTGEKQSETPDDSTATLVVDSTDASTPEE
jgi:hypothetical protein